ncbi:hypothetical protein GGI15_000731 [Coemansia interrupta]|uniref:K Homology domain-containing protein n=1 Tax=Coemansia interrupta TaxID=1126814 RepID=A0A9W8HKS8_9FUNG|nr:hypothetical protein GGI15_000731 [Coemansia interrupta]
MSNVSDSAATRESRKRRWDGDADGQAISEHLPVMPEKRQEEGLSRKRIEREYTTDVDINSSANRQSLAKSSTHRSISDATGAEVTTRGKYYENADDATPDDPALHLHVDATSQDSLDRAVAMIERLKSEVPNDGTSTSSLHNIADAEHESRNDRHDRPTSAAGSSSAGYTRLEEKVYVYIESERGFNVRAKLIGTGGENMKYIQNTTGVRVQVRGRGSGYNDRDGYTDSHEPMHLHVTASSEESLNQARGYCQSLIDTIKEQYDEFKESGGRGGRYYEHHGRNGGGGRDGRDYGRNRHQQPYHNGSSQYGDQSYSSSRSRGYNHGYQQHQYPQDYISPSSATGSTPTAGTNASTDASAADQANYAEYYAQYYQYYGYYPDYSNYYANSDTNAVASDVNVKPMPTSADTNSNIGATTDKDPMARYSPGRESAEDNGYHSVPPPPSYDSKNNKV